MGKILRIRKKIILFIIVLIIIALFLFRSSPVGQSINFLGNQDTSINSPNATNSLKFPTAYNTSQVTHDSLVKFDDEWNGYKYWMANTPYPNANARKENPHIFASNDLVNWQVPEGLKNPLDEVKDPYSKVKDNSVVKYNSDTHLLYNKEMSRLELFWRYVDIENNAISIFFRTSKDGVEWSKKRLSYTGVFKESDMISPAIIKEKNLYKLWYVTNDFNIDYRESKDALTWSKPSTIIIKYNDPKIKHWHLDVQQNDGKYEMLISSFEKKSAKRNHKDRKRMSLYYSASDDNKTWSDAIEIIKPSNIVGRWDGRGLYRSSFIKDKGKYVVLYSGVSHRGVRGVGISYGKDINNLKGLSENDPQIIANFLKKKY